MDKFRRHLNHVKGSRHVGTPFVGHHQHGAGAFGEQSEGDGFRTDGQAVVEILGLEVDTPIGFAARDGEALDPGDLAGEGATPQGGCLKYLKPFSLTE